MFHMTIIALRSNAIIMYYYDALIQSIAIDAFQTFLQSNPQILYCHHEGHIVGALLPNLSSMLLVY